jgi:hypothetical protein
MSTYDCIFFCHINNNSHAKVTFDRDSSLGCDVISIGSGAYLLQYTSVVPKTIAHPTSTSAMRRSPNLKELNLGAVLTKGEEHKNEFQVPMTRCK